MSIIENIKDSMKRTAYEKSQNGKGIVCVETGEEIEIVEL